MQHDAKPVFVQHGLFADADFWAVHQEQSLAVKLAKAGFNVWLGNNRGSRYGRSNAHLDPSKDASKFFDYSFYELGQYDAPA